MNETTKSDELMPPIFMATTRQKILLKSHVSPKELETTDQTNPINQFGRITKNLFSSNKRA
jgi:hypothetical protein